MADLARRCQLGQATWEVLPGDHTRHDPGRLAVRGQPRTRDTPTAACSTPALPCSPPPECVREPCPLLLYPRPILLDVTQVRTGRLPAGVRPGAFWVCVQADAQGTRPVAVVRAVAAYVLPSLGVCAATFGVRAAGLRVRAASLRRLRCHPTAHVLPPCGVCAATLRRPCCQPSASVLPAFGVCAVTWRRPCCHPAASVLSPNGPREARITPWACWSTASSIWRSSRSIRPKPNACVTR